MRIVNRSEFLAMPAGTVFNKWTPCYFQHPCIKGDTWNHCQDFLVQYLDGLRYEDGENSMGPELRLEDGQECPMDFDSMSRDGCFEDDQLFAVWSDADVEALIVRLQKRKDYQ